MSAVNARLIPPNAGARIVYTTPDGQYLGSVTFDAASQDAIGVIGKLFAEWCAQQSGSIQLASAIRSAVRPS